MCIDVLISMSNLAGVFEASRCIASQRAPDELFAAVIRAVIEVSGARKGYLLLAEGEMLWLAAEGEVSDQIVNVLKPRCPLSLTYSTRVPA
jgi:hypothetical protein